MASKNGIEGTDVSMKRRMCSGTTGRGRNVICLGVRRNAFCARRRGYRSSPTNVRDEGCWVHYERGRVCTMSRPWSPRSTIIVLVFFWDVRMARPYGQTRRTGVLAESPGCVRDAQQFRQVARAQLGHHARLVDFDFGRTPA